MHDLTNKVVKKTECDSCDLGVEFNHSFSNFGEKWERGTAWTPRGSAVSDQIPLNTIRSGK